MLGTGGFESGCALKRKIGGLARRRAARNTINIKKEIDSNLAFNSTLLQNDLNYLDTRNENSIVSSMPDIEKMKALPREELKLQTEISSH